ncbi:MAG: redox-regulated ATPase YchF [Candidatus Babeliaceae bacterium]
MSIAAGLVGLPNVGKSTLFNALTNSSVPAENYPFCTIDPHLACTFVPDERIEKLLKIYNSKKTIPASVQFVDIAGLVQGAASGEGLGNQFLSHIRAVDLILHVVRCFDDPLISYSRNEIDPLFDLEIITTELMLKDIESVEKRSIKVAQLLKSSKNNPAQTKELEQEAQVLEQIKAALNGSLVEQVRKLVAEYKLTSIDLLSAKKFIIIANIAESEIAHNAYLNNPYFKKLSEKFGSRVIPVCARLEYELSQLTPSEAQEMAGMMGLEKSGLQEIIASTYKHLGLITFFTCGPQEIHAWPIKAGMTVRQAAGEIHSDLEKGFICADVFNCADLFNLGTETKVKEAGKMRIEGQDYIVKDGDIINVKFNV